MIVRMIVLDTSGRGKCTRRWVWAALVVAALCCGGTSSRIFGQTLHYANRPDVEEGEKIYKGGCIACHGADGKGAPETYTVFKRADTWPDFTACDQTTPEPNGNWKAAIVHGGPSRGLSQIMPAFGDLLTDAQINDVIAYMRGFCKNTHHFPLGELNLPRALVTEKAFPENELVVSTAVGTKGKPAWTTDVIDERTVIDARTQLETDVPVNYAVLDASTGGGPGGGWTEGVGDITLGLKRTLFSSLRTGSILSVQGGILLPTGDSRRGFGAGTTQFEPFAAFDQLFRTNTFLQTELGADLPVDTSVAPRSMFYRAAVGQALAPDHMLGRLFSPMVEFLGVSGLQTGGEYGLGCAAGDAGDGEPAAACAGGFRVQGAVYEYGRANAAGSVLCALGSGGREIMGRLAMRAIWGWAGVLVFVAAASFPAAVRGKGAGAAAAGVANSDQDGSEGGEREGRSGGAWDVLSDLGPVCGVPQRDGDEGRRGCFDRAAVGGEHYGECVARPLLAGEYPAGGDGSS